MSIPRGANEIGSDRQAPLTTPPSDCQMGNPMVTSGNGKKFRIFDRIRLIDSRYTA